MKKNQTPVVSIITIVYNDARNIEHTIRSVQNQSYKNIEYIIIDGGSTDGTIDILEKYTNLISYWHSEPDNGIYDAMNKGLKAATGEYVWFINSGDEIYNEGTLDIISKNFTLTDDIYYGEAMYIDNDRNEIGLRSEITPHKLPDQLTWRDMNRGMVVCHQSFIVKRSIAPEYNVKFSHSGDIDWVIQCLKKTDRVINTGMVMSKYLIGGYSKQFHLRSLLDRYRVLQNHFGVLPNFLNHIAVVLRAIKHSGKKA